MFEQIKNWMKSLKTDENLLKELMSQEVVLPKGGSGETLAIGSPTSCGMTTLTAGTANFTGCTGSVVTTTGVGYGVTLPPINTNVGTSYLITNNTVNPVTIYPTGNWNIINAAGAAGGAAIPYYTNYGGGGGAGGVGGFNTVYTTTFTQPYIPMSISNAGGKEIVRLNADGTVSWANGIQVDEAAEAFAKSLNVGAEMSAGITRAVKLKMRDSVFEDLIAIANEKGPLSAEELKYLLQASKIVEKLQAKDK